MTIQLRGSSFPAGTGAATVPVNIPAGVQAGDLLLAFWASATPAPSIAVSGWTNVGYSQGTSTNLQLVMYTHVVGSSAEAGTEVDFALGATTAQGAAILAYYDDAGGTVTVDSEAFRVGTGLSLPADTTVHANAVAVAASCSRTGTTENTSTWGAPSGHTLIGHNYLASGSGKSWAVSHNLTPVSAGTNIGGGSFTQSNSPGNTATLTVALYASVVVTTHHGTASGGLRWDSGHPTVADLIAQPHGYAAHRGGMDEIPSETIAGYNTTGPIGNLIVLETDCQLNASGSIVMWHDATITDGTTTVASQTDTQWNTLTVPWPTGHTGNPSPAPASYWHELADAWGGKRILMPEMKDAGAVDTALLNDIEARGIKDSCIVQCFDTGLTRLSAAVARGFHTMSLYGTTPATSQWATVAAAGVEFIGLTAGAFTSTDVTAAHAAGLKVWAYVINTTTSRDTNFAAGVDGIFTNDPSSVPVAGSLLVSLPGAVGHAPTVTTHHGSAAGTFHFTGAAAGHDTRHGTASGAFHFTGAAVGHTARHGATTGSVHWTGHASGHTARHGTATGTIHWTGTAGGHDAHRGAAVGGLVWHGVATGHTTKHGTATGSTVWHGVAQGHATRHAAATGTVSWTGHAAGHTTRHATTTGTIAWHASATGHAPTLATKHGTAAGGIAWAGLALGHAPVVGSKHGHAVGGITWTATATGHTTRHGVANGTAHWAGTATGHTSRHGTAAGGVSWSVTAAGHAPTVTGHHGAATGTVVWHAVAQGHTDRHGTALGGITWVGVAHGPLPPAVGLEFTAELAPQPTRFVAVLAGQPTRFSATLAVQPPVFAATLQEQFT